MERKIRQHCGALLIVLLGLSGCSVMPSPAPQTSAAAEAERGRAALSQWTLKARLTTPDQRASLRWRQSERWGYVAFIDVGAAEEDFQSAAESMRAAFGLGLRFYPGFGPIRLDIATPLNARDGDDPVQVYVSIGQAF